MTHRAFLRIGVCASTAIWIGCGAHSSPRSSIRAETPDARDEGFEPFRCGLSEAIPEEREALEQQARAEALRLPADLDYVSIGRYRSATSHYVIAASGAPCRNARDQAACKANVEGLEAASQTKPQVFAITTRGDDVELHKGEAVLSFIGAIDTPERAWLALMVREAADVYDCDDAYWSGHRRAPGGLELAMLWTKSICQPFERVRTIFHVSSDGIVTRRGETVVEHNAERCMVSEAAVRGEPAQPAAPQRFLR
jgi:hypothetical protein